MEKLTEERDQRMAAENREKEQNKRLQRQLRDTKEEMAELAKKEAEASRKKHELVRREVGRGWLIVMGFGPSVASCQVLLGQFLMPGASSSSLSIKLPSAWVPFFDLLGPFKCDSPAPHPFLSFPHYSVCVTPACIAPLFRRQAKARQLPIFCINLCCHWSHFLLRPFPT